MGTCVSCKTNETEYDGFNCEMCRSSLENDLNDWTIDNIDEGIEDQSMIKWMKKMFITMQPNYIDFGNVGDTYQDFLVGTYEAEH